MKSAMFLAVGLMVALGVSGAEASGAPDKALAEVKALIEREEARIAGFVAEEKTPLRKLQMEYLRRQDAAARLADELRRAVMTEAFSSPEVERLRTERKALQAKLEAVREALVAAGYETEGAKAMQAAMAENEKRLTALRATLWPKSGQAPVDGKGPKDGGRKAE